MSEFPAITHVAVTVTDLSVSVPWYTRLIGAEPVLDEDTGPFRHVVYAIGGTLLGLHAFPGGVREPGPFHQSRSRSRHEHLAVDERRGRHGPGRTWMRSPGRPKMLSTSTGPSPVLPNQCGS